jgi:hypothetical protein
VQAKYPPEAMAAKIEEGERIVAAVVLKTGDGAVLLQLRHRWAGATTHLRFDPFEFLGDHIGDAFRGSARLHHDAASPAVL